MPFVNRYMIDLVALNEVLRYILRGMVHVPLKPSVRSDLLENHSPNSAGFRVPRNVITSFEDFRHMAFLSPWNRERVDQPAWSQYSPNSSVRMWSSPTPALVRSVALPLP